MKDYNKSLNLAVAALLLDKGIKTEVKQQAIADIREVQGKMEQEESTELIYPEGSQV